MNFDWNKERLHFPWNKVHKVAFIEGSRFPTLLVHKIRITNSKIVNSSKWWISEKIPDFVGFPCNKILQSEEKKHIF